MNPVLSSFPRNVVLAASNRHPDFQIYTDSELTKAPVVMRKGVVRGFLGTRWIKPADVSIGLLMVGTHFYNMRCSDRLALLLRDPMYKAVRAICSFQTYEDDTRAVICQVFYKVPFVETVSYAKPDEVSAILLNK